MFETHHYGALPDQVADLQLPPGDVPRGGYPVAVLLHGGFWSEEYDREQMSALANDLVERGWATWNVEYRRVGPRSGGGWPRTGEDVAAALDHLADVDAPLRLDRVVVIGHSAGGQLALWLGARSGSGTGRVRVRAAVGQAPATDLERAAHAPLGGEQVRAYMGGDPDEVRRHYLDASPAARLPLRVPQLLVHGEADDIVPARASRRYVEAARAGGDRASLVLRSDDGHFDHLNPRSVVWAAVVQWLEPFAV